MKKSFLKIFSLLFLFVLLISCDKDFNSLDSDVIGDDHFDLVKYPVQNLIAYSKATGPMQTNNLPLNALGIYNNPKFGLTKAHFVTQVELGTENPSFGYNPVIDSVYLYVPYFVDSDFTTETSGERIYKLDSIYGNPETGKFKLNVIESKYYLRDFDPSDDLQSAQNYYSDEKSIFDVPAHRGEILNTSSNIAQNDEFYFSKKELYIYKTDGAGLYIDANGAVLSNQNDASLRVIKERKTPGMWLDLKNSFFQEKILDAASSGNLFNNNAFKNYFRGLLFEVEEISPNQGAMAILDFSRAEFKIIYKSSIEPTTENPSPARTRKEFSLKMGYNALTSLRSNCVNFLEQSYAPEYLAGLNDADPVLGNEKLYIKGGDGSIAFIDLFGNGELDRLRQEVAEGNKMINDARLTFYIDKDYMSTVSDEPLRIFVFDATNNKVVIDYTFDSSTSSNPKNSKVVYGGMIQKETIGGNNKTIKYTIRLTEHIRRILKADANGVYLDNVKLGVSVTESINLISSVALKTSIQAGSDQVANIPMSSVLNPLGTALHGPLSTETYENNEGDIIPMKLQMIIYFTEPNNE